MSKVLQDWTFGGVRLSEFGAITELDPYLDMPPKRGDNVLVPMVHGKTWVPKFFDSRVLSFGIEVAAGSIIELEETMDALKALLGVRVQKTLVHSHCDGPRTAMAEVMGQLGVTRDPDPLVAKIVVDFLLADPFFRSSVINHQTVTIGANPQNFTLVNPGTAEERKAIITIYGASDQAVITNTTNGVVLEYAAVVAGGEHVTIDCGAYSAVYTPGALNVVGNIIHSGDSAFMTFVPGNNILTIEDTTGTNLFQVDFDFYPPYL